MSSSISVVGADLLGRSSRLVVRIKSEPDLFSRWLEFVVASVFGLALLVKNNTGNFTIEVVAR